MANRQLKILRDDFMRYYNRTSFVMRILIGAALSFAIAYYALNKHIKPQMAAIKDLQKKMSKMVIVDDVDLMMSDLNNRRKKVEKKLNAFSKANSELMKKSGQLTRSESGKIIIEIRSLLDQNSIKIISETRVNEKKAARPRRRKKSSGQMNKNKRIKLELPQLIGDDVHQFIVHGTYKHIKTFLMEVYNHKATFFLNNIYLERTDEFITDRELNQYNALKCCFELHIPYRKEKAQQ